MCSLDCERKDTEVWHKNKPWNCCSRVQKFLSAIVSGLTVFIVSIFL